MTETSSKTRSQAELAKSVAILFPPGFRSRREHQKSRHGCIRCKQQRKKCDEAVPRCSRCATRNHDCRYTKDTSKGGQPTFLRDRLRRPDSNRANVPYASSSQHSYENSVDSHESVPSSAFGLLLELRTDEKALWNHYLEHTSRKIPFDDDDKYVLQRGIPTLALSNRALMCSVLALSAAGKCYELASAPLSEMHTEQIRVLLKNAEYHHLESLQYAQFFWPNPDRYACLLANAALMVLYGCASQCIRVRLAHNARENGGSLPADLAPTPSQWIILIRAAHTAFVSVINAADDSRKSSSRWTNAFPPGDSYSKSKLPKRRAFASGDGWSIGNRRFSLTIRTTCGMALDDLSSKLTTAQGAIVHLDSGVGVCDMTDSHLGLALNIEDCFAAFQVLRNVACAAGLAETKTQQPLMPSSRDTFAVLEQLDQVPTWLRCYLARVTSYTTPKALRRIITSFLNKVPLSYLRFIENVLDAMPEDDDCYSELACLQLDQTQLLALDIFAHWLVLMMLLDDVWWIGGIGEWELGRVVDFMQRQDGRNGSKTIGASWWPKKMYDAKRRGGSAEEKQLAWHASLWQCWV